MLILTHASLATVDQLFQYKHSNYKLDDFPGYTNDQWGIKAHNRPWIESAGNFSSGQTVIEVGGGYSLFPKYLHEKYRVESWIGDDFGSVSGDSIWSRWGDPKALPFKYPSTKYVFEPFGKYSTKYPDQYFDRVFSISTLEHIPFQSRLDVFKDMNRVLRQGGRQLHTIDISTNWKKLLVSSFFHVCPIIKNIHLKVQSEIRSWVRLIKNSGVIVDTPIPNPIKCFDRKILVETPDVVYRFYPPNNEPSEYRPSASLLLIIEDK
jgi:hypothetical protein